VPHLRQIQHGTPKLLAFNAVDDGRRVVMRRQDSSECSAIWTDG
jgi:hypothetical protein